MGLTVKIALIRVRPVIPMDASLAQQAMILVVLMEDSTMELTVKIALINAIHVTLKVV